MDHLTHQRRLLPAICTSCALQAVHDRLTRDDVAVLAEPGGAAQRGVEALGTGLKAVATWHMVEAFQPARECCGGNGYLAENRFASLRANSDVFVTFEGDNTVLKQLLAKTLLADVASQFEDLDVVGTVRAVTTQRAGRVLSDLTRSLRGEPDLLDPAWQGEDLLLREERLVDGLARRLQTLVKSGTDPLRALSQCQDHALSAARAHIERRAHELFSETVDASDLPLLAQVRDLSAIERGRAWWLEHGLLTAETSRGRQKQVNALCVEL